MPTPFDLNFPYGATPRGFAAKNTFADQLRLLGDARVVMDVGTHEGHEAATYRAMFFTNETVVPSFTRIRSTPATRCCRSISAQVKSSNSAMR